MGRYVIAIGGTGSKLMESMVYAACADAFYTRDENGRRYPVPQLDLLSVDVDASCGNTTRAKRAAESYEQVRRTLSHSPLAHHCFHTALNVDRWSVNFSRRAASVAQMSRDHGHDRLLARTLFSRTEMELEYSEGFRGHPDLGVLFFTDLLSTLDESRKQGLPDELNAMIDRMQSDIDHGDTVQLMLCGSIFGGTGASGIPALSHYLHAHFAAHSDKFVMGALLMLPYYKVPAANVDESREIAVKSDDFLDKARTALQYYGMEGMLKSAEDDENGVFDAMYLLGLPPEHFVSTRIYSTGSQSQENDAHMLEWLAARCAARFMRTGFRGRDAHNIDCYYYQWHTPHMGWNSFDDEEDLYRARYGALIKASAVYLSECYPTLRDLVRRTRGSESRVGYCAAYFHRMRRRSAAQRAAVAENIEALYRFLAFYINWTVQVVTTLPPAMCVAPPVGGDLPQNGLYDAALLRSLHDLLYCYGSDLRDEGRIERLCIALQKGIEKLVITRVPDRQTIGRIIAGLGGGECTGAAPEAAFASFLTALISVVSHEN